jgi:hypothetical protein
MTDSILPRAGCLVLPLSSGWSRDAVASGRRSPGCGDRRQRHRRPAGHRTTPRWRPENPATELDPIAQGITTIIWRTGLRPDWSWIDLPIFDGSGYPTHTRGVTAMPGVYVLGLPWLYT